MKLVSNKYYCPLDISFRKELICQPCILLLVNDGLSMVLELFSEMKRIDYPRSMSSGLSYRPTHLVSLGFFLPSMTTMTRRLLTENKERRREKGRMISSSRITRPPLMSPRWTKRSTGNNHAPMILNASDDNEASTDSITTRLCPHYRFQKGRQKILNYDTVDIRHKHHTIVALPSTRDNCANGQVIKNNAEHFEQGPSQVLLLW